MGQAKTNRVWRSGISVVLFTGLAVAPFLTAKAQAQEDDVGIRGLVRSKHKVEIRSAMSARLLHAPFRDGMRFKAGDLLLAFDCRVPKARLAGAEAEQEAASIEYRNKERLRRNRAAGQAEVTLAKVELDRTRAAAQSIAAQVEDCRITAPFSGRVVSQLAREHERPENGQPLMVILNDHDLELELVLPSHWLRWLSPGESFTFTVDETGKTIAA